MDILSIVNFIIAMAAVFFFCSMLASHINELIAGYRNARGKRLEAFLTDALGQEVATEIYNHILIKSTKNRNGLPNYIETSVFGRVVQDLFADTGSNLGKSRLFVMLEKEAEAEGVKLASKVEEWFALANESLTGRYTRTTTMMLFVIGLFMAGAFDIDTFQIARSLSADTAKLEAIADKIQELTPKDPANPTEEEKSALYNAAAPLVDLSSGPLFYGWQALPPSGRWDLWLMKLLGWIVTGIAVSFGSQFWFRILSEALKVRQTQQKPEEREKESGQEEEESKPPPQGEDALGAGGTPQNLVFATYSPQAVEGNVLGRLSSRYEVGNRGPGTVSNGAQVGDPGGDSYGSYQMTSSNGGGTVKQFVAKSSYPAIQPLRNLKPGSAQFTAEWKAIAKADPAGFFRAQHDFIKLTHYDPAVAGIKAAGKVDVTKRTDALQNVVWSTAVQHGAAGGPAIVAKAMEKMGGTTPASGFDYDEKLIRAIYAERGRKKPDGTLVYFSKSSPKVQRGVADRFTSELKDALRMLDEEKPVEV